VSSIATKVRVKSVNRWMELLKIRSEKERGQYIGNSFAMIQRPTQGIVHYYRGQLDSMLPLQTSLERFCSKRGLDWGNEREIILLERIMHQRFKEMVSELVKTESPLPENTLEWEMKMRHYGLPSRLLDVSKNYRTALYFACWQGDADFAVWEFRCNLLDSFSATSPIVFVSPQRYFDDRIQAQEGAFIRQNSIGRSFSEAISVAFNIESLVYMRNGGDLTNDTRYEDIAYKDSKIVKWVFPSDLRSQTKESLRNEDHFGKTLFPDISGVVETIMTNVEANDFTRDTGNSLFQDTLDGH